MKKAIAGIVLLIIVAAIFYFINNLDGLVKAAIEKYGSDATKTLVRVDKVKIKLKEGSAGIYGLNVGNPANFSEPNIFSLGEISTKIDFTSVKSETLIINDIQVLAPKVFIEINQDGVSNLTELKKNLTANTTTSTPESQTEPATSGKPIKLMIQNIRFAEGDISAKVTPLNKSYNIDLPSIELKSLGAPNGATPDELTKQILSQFIDQLLAASKKGGYFNDFETIKNKAKEEFQEKKEALKGEAEEKVEAEKNRAKDKLKGFLEKSNF